MMLITACRREEVCAMRFEDIIEDVWYVPAEIRKNKEELKVPLTWYAQTIVGAQGETSGLVFKGSKGKALDNWDRWQKKIFELTKTESWHRHDLRRTAATLLGDAGVSPHIVEIVLGHKTPHSELASIYNQSRYELEHEQALKVLSDIICGLEVRGKQNDQPSLYP
jgi:integrase